MCIFLCYKYLSEQIFTLNLFESYYSEQAKFLNLSNWNETWARRFLVHKRIWDHLS